MRDADGVAAPEGKSIKFLGCVQLEADGPLRLLLPRDFVEGLERPREEPAVAARLLVAERALRRAGLLQRVGARAAPPQSSTNFFDGWVDRPPSLDGSNPGNESTTRQSSVTFCASPAATFSRFSHENMNAQSPCTLRTLMFDMSVRPS